MFLYFQSKCKEFIHFELWCISDNWLSCLLLSNVVVKKEDVPYMG